MSRNNILETVQIILETGEVQRGLRFSPVENLIAVGDVNGSLAFVDVQNPNEVERIVVQEEAEVFPSRFTPDGKRLLVVARGNDKTVCVVYSIDHRNEVARWTVPQNENCAAISPSGERVATGHEDGVRIWSVNDTSDNTRIPIRSIRGIDFSPDGRFLVAGTGDGLIEIIDFETLIVERQLAGHLQHIGDLKFSPDGKRLASAGTTNDALKVWDFESGRELVTFEAAVGGTC